MCEITLKIYISKNPNAIDPKIMNDQDEIRKNFVVGINLSFNFSYFPVFNKETVWSPSLLS